MLSCVVATNVLNPAQREVKEYTKKKNEKRNKKGKLSTKDMQLCILTGGTFMLARIYLFLVECLCTL
jgi:hypothetical protein